MARYILNRILQIIPVFLGATFLVYLLVFLMPGDPIAAMFGDKPVAEAVKEQLRQQYNLDKPFYVQYLLFIKGVLTFNMGDDFTGRPISEILKSIFPVTAKLAFLAIIFESVFGILFGLWAGLRKGKLFDKSVLVLSLVVIAMPTFVLGFIVQFVFGIKLGIAKPTVSSAAALHELILPAMVLGLISFGYIIRLTRTSVIENRNADYVRTATAKGLSSRKVINRHVLRNSLIPVITYIGADLGGLMGGAIVTEGIFNIPGVGGKLFLAIQQGQGPTVVAIVSILIVIYLLANLLVDILYAFLDPRIRYGK